MLGIWMPRRRILMASLLTSNPRANLRSQKPIARSSFVPSSLLEWIFPPSLELTYGYTDCEVELVRLRIQMPVAWHPSGRHACWSRTGETGQRSTCERGKIDQLRSTSTMWRRARQCIRLHAKRQHHSVTNLTRPDLVAGNLYHVHQTFPRRVSSNNIRKVNLTKVEDLNIAQGVLQRHEEACH